MPYDPSQPSPQSSYAGAREIDAGLQAYMQSVYHTMGLGLVVTGLVAFAVAHTPALYNLIFGIPLVWVAVAFSPMAFIIFGFTPGRMQRVSAEKLKLTFIMFSAVMGLSMATIFIMFTGASVARVFFITAATFAATSLYGYTAKRDLTGVGSFLVMGLVGIVLAGIVNIFMHSPMVQFVISAAGVLIFTGLTAWETQKLKNVYRAGDDEGNAKMAISGALSLYLNFINLFQMLLRFMGDRR